VKLHVVWSIKKAKGAANYLFSDGCMDNRFSGVQDLIQFPDHQSDSLAVADKDISKPLKNQTVQRS
jgi:hypothetical protein